MLAVNNNRPLVVTIIFFGSTNSYEDHKHFLPGWAFDLCLEPKHVIDGVGSGFKDVDRRYREKFHHWNAASAGALGAGMADNVLEGLAFIQHVLDTNANTSPSSVQINVLGHSRGGIQCLILAWELYNKTEWRDIQCKLFLLDPVPGPLNSLSTKRKSVSPNVCYAELWICEHERAPGFETLVPLVQDPARTKLAVDVLPGYHLAVVGDPTSEPFVMKRKAWPIWEDVAFLSRSIAIDFLKKHGSIGPDCVCELQMKRQDYLQTYSRIKKSWAEIAAKKGMMHPIGSPGRYRNVKVGREVPQCLEHVQQLQNFLKGNRPHGSKEIPATASVNLHHLNLVAAEMRHSIESSRVTGTPITHTGDSRIHPTRQIQPAPPLYSPPVPNEILRRNSPPPSPPQVSVNAQKKPIIVSASPWTPVVNSPAPSPQGSAMSVNQTIKTLKAFVLSQRSGGPTWCPRKQSPSWPQPSPTAQPGRHVSPRADASRPPPSPIGGGQPVNPNYSSSRTLDILFCTNCGRKLTGSRIVGNLVICASCGAQCPIRVRDVAAVPEARPPVIPLRQDFDQPRRQSFG